MALQFYTPGGFLACPGYTTRHTMRNVAGFLRMPCMLILKARANCILRCQSICLTATGIRFIIHATWHPMTAGQVLHTSPYNCLERRNNTIFWNSCLLSTAGVSLHTQCSSLDIFQCNASTLLCPECCCVQGLCGKVKQFCQAPAAVDAPKTCYKKCCSPCSGRRATIPSGSLTLDIALGGGLPRGRIIEVTMSCKNL